MHEFHARRTLAHRRPAYRDSCVRSTSLGRVWDAERVGRFDARAVLPPIRHYLGDHWLAEGASTTLSSRPSDLYYPTRQAGAHAGTVESRLVDAIVRSAFLTRSAAAASERVEGRSLLPLIRASATPSARAVYLRARYGSSRRAVFLGRARASALDGAHRSVEVVVRGWQGFSAALFASPRS